MALKDLIATREKLNESLIEEAVSSFVRFDSEKEEIILLPTSNRLNSRQKILLYLVANEGWSYLDLESKPVSPSIMEESLGIPGGTLRPILRKLAEERLIRSVKGTYSIIPVNIHAVINEIKAESPAGAKQTSKKSKAKKAKPSNRPKSTSLGSSQKLFEKLFGSGFFKEPRSLSELQNEFHNRGEIVKMTSLSSIPLKAVREGRLTRKKSEGEGRKIWLYTEKLDA